MAKHTSFLMLITMISNDGPDAAAMVKSQLITESKQICPGLWGPQGRQPTDGCWASMHSYSTSTSSPHTQQPGPVKKATRHRDCRTLPHQCSCFLPFVSQWHQSLGTTLLFGLSLPGPSPASTYLCFQAIKLALLLRVILSFPAKPQPIRVSAHSLGPDISSVASHNRENQSFVLPPNFYLKRDAH